MIWTIVSLAFQVYFVYGIALAALVAAYQESKIWKPQSVPSLSVIGLTKVFFFNILWMSGCALGSVVILCKWLLSCGTSDIARDGNCIVERIVAKVGTLLLVGQVSVKGLDKIPSDIEGSRPAPVFIANHSSQLDTASVYFLNQRWKWIAKLSVMMLPGVGQVMMLSRHIAIDRATGKNKRSVSNLFDKSNDAVQSGVPMFLFPQGTRQIAEKRPFKSGAFVVAQKNKSPLIPISIEIPRNAWNTLYPMNLLWGGKAPVIKITVHDLIPVSGNEEMDSLKKTAMERIYSVLPPVPEDPRKEE